MTLPLARSPALRQARSTLSTRLIWPAPTPTSDSPLASTIAFERTCFTARQANSRLVSFGQRRLAYRHHFALHSRLWQGVPGLHQHAAQHPLHVKPGRFGIALRTGRRHDAGRHNSKVALRPKQLERCVV